MAGHRLVRGQCGQFVKRALVELRGVDVIRTRDPACGRTRHVVRRGPALGDLGRNRAHAVRLSRQGSKQRRHLAIVDLGLERRRAHQFGGALGIVLRIGAQRLDERLAAGIARLGGERDHFGADTLDLVEPDLVDLVGRQRGRGLLPNQECVVLRALGQRRNAVSLAALGQVLRAVEIIDLAVFGVERAGDQRRGASLHRTPFGLRNIKRAGALERGIEARILGLGGDYAGDRLLERGQGRARLHVASQHRLPCNLQRLGIELGELGQATQIADEIRLASQRHRIGEAGKVLEPTAPDQRECDRPLAEAVGFDLFGQQAAQDRAVGAIGGRQLRFGNRIEPLDEQRGLRGLVIGFGQTVVADPVVISVNADRGGKDRVRFKKPRPVIRDHAVQIVGGCRCGRNGQHGENGCNH